MNFLLSSAPLLALAAIPCLGWVKLYRLLDRRDVEPLRPTFLAFLAGMISTVPVFGIQYVLIKNPDLNFVHLLQENITNPFWSSTAFLLFVALIEELFKAGLFLSIFREQEKYFNQVVDGIVYGALVGLGFGVVENVYYFYQAQEVFGYSSQFFVVFTIRSFGTLLAHTLFTAIFGFYFAKAYFSPFIEESSKQERVWRNLGKNLKEAVKFHATFFHLMPEWSKKRHPEPLLLNRNAIILEGYVIAVLLHLLYNTLIKQEVFGQNWTFLIAPLIFLMAWAIWSRFFVKLYVKILDFVRMKRDIYRLRVH